MGFCQTDKYQDMNEYTDIQIKKFKQKHKSFKDGSDSVIKLIMIMDSLKRHGTMLFESNAFKVWRMAKEEKAKEEKAKEFIFLTNKAKNKHEEFKFALLRCDIAEKGGFKVSMEELDRSVLETVVIYLDNFLVENEKEEKSEYVLRALKKAMFCKESLKKKNIALQVKKQIVKKLIPGGIKANPTDLFVIFSGTISSDFLIK